LTFVEKFKCVDGCKSKNINGICRIKNKIMFNFADQFFKYAQVAELVDALDSKSSDFGRVGSIPTLSTYKIRNSFKIK
jgi:hypothetical protein